MKRQVADIYATMSSLRQQSVRSKILDLPQDAKLRTKEGRRQAEFDIATAREIQSLKVRHNYANDATLFAPLLPAACCLQQGVDKQLGMTSDIATATAAAAANLLRCTD